MRYTTETFKNAAIEKHGQRYDYSITECNGSKSIVKIICREHGVFLIKAVDHFYGNRKKGAGCPQCGYKQRSEKTIKRNLKGRLTQEEFLRRAIHCHGDRYDYSETVFTGIRYHVDIICKLHGKFSQMAQAHIFNRQGCPSCFKAQRRSILKKSSNSPVVCRQKEFLRTLSLKNLLTNETFIERSIEAHGCQYDYSLSSYVGVNKKLTIICKTHGEFLQTPREHWSGSGCQKCANYATSKMEQDWLNTKEISLRRKLIKIGDKRFYVDGYDPSSNTIYEFLGDYWHGNPTVFDSNEMNTRVKKKFGKLYEETVYRLDAFKNAGYNVCSIWEREWRNANNLQTRKSS